MIMSTAVTLRACVRLLVAGTSVACLTFGSVAAAQVPAPPAAPQPVVVDPLEPDYALINLPTTLQMAKLKSSFHLTHRFLGNLRDGSFKENAGNLFGLDNGAMVGLEYRIALTDRVQAAFYRSSIDKTIQFSGRLDVLQQSSAIPVSVSAFAAIEGNNNFGWHAQGRTVTRAPALGLSVSRTFSDVVALYVVPSFVHNTLVQNDIHRNTFTLGMGGRLRVRPTVYLVGEVAPRLAGYAPGKPEFGFGIEKHAGGHMFQLNFSNTTSTTFAQVARGGFPTTIYFGFNLGRKF